MQRILLVKTSSLGDVIHNLPVVDDILAQFPEAQIDWVVEESFADIPRLHPKINTVYPVAFRRWKKHIFSRSTWTEIAAFRKSIQQNQYDVIIDTQGLLKSGLLTAWANGEKHGYDKNSIREPLASCFYDKTYAISYEQHAVTRNRTLTAQALGYAPPTNAPDYGIKQQGIEQHGISQNGTAKTRVDIGLQAGYFTALHGTSRDSKLWPVEHWVALGKKLAHENMYMALPWASAAEQARAQAISNQVPNSAVLPKLSIGELAGVISSAKFAIGVDTGLSHLAVALNIPTVAIYTDTDPARTGVMAGKVAPAVNLGGIGLTPSMEKVASAIANFSINS